MSDAERYLIIVDATTWLVSAFYWGWACWLVAHEKDRHAVDWGFAGFLAGPLGGLIFLPLAVLPDLTEYDEDAEEAPMTATDDRPLRAVSDVYDEPRIAWAMRTVGRRLHAGIRGVASASEGRGV